MKLLKTARIALLLCPVLLAACAPPAARQVYEPAPPPEPTPPAESSAPSISEVSRAMAIADMLFEARRAVDDNRLMLPRGNNAYDRFREVLSVDPGNAVALQGLQDIVRRYVQLADAAMAAGQFEQAAGHLTRAATIEAASPDLRQARERLAAARALPRDFVALDPGAVGARSAEASARLGEIARRLRADERATFVINARNDAEGRWMYQAMREAVDGYRLRGDITITDRVGVQLRFPPAEATP